MSSRWNRSVILSVVLIAVVALVWAAPARADESAYDGDWHYNLTVYGWLPGIEGNLGFDIPGSDGTISVDAEKLLDNLSFVFMGAFEARKDRWLVLANLQYVQEKASQSESIPILDDGAVINVGAELELDMWVTALAGGYEVARTDLATFQVLLGGRYLSLSGDLALDIDGPLPGDLPTANFSQSGTLFDGFVGAKGRIGKETGFFAPYYLDLGAGTSKFTWQWMTGVGYDWHWGGVLLAYRYLYFDQGDDQFIHDMAFSGAAVAVHFRW